MCNVFAVNGDRTLLCGSQAGNNAQQSTLAATAGSQQRNDLTLRYIQAQTVEDTLLSLPAMKLNPNITALDCGHLRVHFRIRKMACDQLVDLSRNDEVVVA
jgi:hypothetical protein